MYKRQVSRKLAETGKIGKGSQAKVLYGAEHRSIDAISELVFYDWGSRSPETACVSAPASRLGGESHGFWQYDRRRETAAGAAALVSRQWNPPPTSQENNNMTIRRIYNKRIYKARVPIFALVYVRTVGGALLCVTITKKTSTR